jgi:cell wall-associated NlpC family hydrolase
MVNKGGETKNRRGREIDMYRKKTYRYTISNTLNALLVSSILIFLGACSGAVKFADKSYPPSQNRSARKNAPPITKSRPLSETIEKKKKPARDFDTSKERFSDSSDLREKLLTHARKWIGVPYRWGGNSKSGVDCSGLVVQVFGEESYTLPRTAAGQFSYLPIVDEISELEIGDLVFFSYDGTHINHVGIYAGYGTMIHASSSRGVVEDNFLSGWFGGKFAGGGIIS